MELLFDLRKAIAATAFLMKKEGGQLNMFLGIKMLYLADKKALVEWGKTITGDKMVSMQRGPVLSNVYNLFKGEAAARKQKEWDAVFSSKVNNSIQQIKPVDVEILSKREMAMLESARKEVNSCAPWDVAKWLHEVCPEWRDPKGSSSPINHRVILKNAGRTDEEIKTIEESNSTFVQNTRELLGVS